MKKTFLAMLLLGGTMSMFAQNTQTGTTGNQSGTTGTTGTTGSSGTTGTTTQGTTGTTNSPAMGTTNSGTMNNGTMNNGTMNNGTMNNGSTNNGTMNGTTANGSMNNGTTGTWNGVNNNSTSWAPEKDPSWSWNNYGVWNGSANWNANSNGTSVYGSNNMGNSSMNNGSTTNNNGMNNGNMSSDGSMSSTGSYNAFSGVAVPSLPANVQMRFSQDFPAGVNNQYAWHQYGDWFHTHHLTNGRLMQYFYDQRGSGYALALPVLQSYVPENIVASALNKYGSSLYSIATVKTQDGKDVYQIGLLQRGQMNMHYLDEGGVSVANIWRVDSLDNGGAMNSMQSNAAMGSDASMNGQATTGDDIKTKDGKVEIEHADGSETKIKWEKDKTKVKTKNGKTKYKQN